jgi:hypothetical protein
VKLPWKREPVDPDEKAALEEAERKAYELEYRASKVVAARKLWAAHDPFGDAIVASIRNGRKKP